MDTLPGIMAPIEETELEKLLGRLRTNETEALNVRSGYLVTSQGDSAVLLEAYVCPVVDAFGLFLGDLIVVIPWQGDALTQVNTISAIVVDDKVFTSREAGVDSDQWGSLVEVLHSDLSENATSTVVINEEAFVCFSRQLVYDSRFPITLQATLFSLKEQEVLQQTIANVLILIVAGGLIFSLVLSVGVAQGLNNPIARLKAAVTRVGQGDFTARVENQSHDEIGELSLAFNQMAEDLSLKERYKNVLSQVTDSKVADRLMRGEVELGGEELDVTILFCDIRGFTNLSAGMDPHRLVSFLNKHMTAMTEVAYKYGGVVDKFVGDEIMVLFGAPIQSENDIQNAFACAQEMVRRRTEMNLEAETPLQVGIGMAHGKVVAGCMGSKDRLNYTVVGESVNLASRLCSEAREMEIAVDGAMKVALGSKLAQSEKKVKSLKGFKVSTLFYLVRKVDET